MARTLYFERDVRDTLVAVSNFLPAYFWLCSKHALRRKDKEHSSTLQHFLQVNGCSLCVGSLKRCSTIGECSGHDVADSHCFQDAVLEA